MYHAWSPLQLLHRFEHTTREEHHSCIVVLELGTLLVGQYRLAREEVVVIDEVYLNTSRRYGRHLDNQLMVVIVDDKVHTRESYHLVELIAALVYTAIARHKCANLIAMLLHSLRKLSAQTRLLVLGKIRHYLLTNVQYFIVRHRFCFLCFIIRIY